TGTIQPITYHLIEALDGGTIDLSNVTEISGLDGGTLNLRGIQVLADGINSQVDLSSLTSFTNDAPEPDSKITVRNNGMVIADRLTALDGTGLVLDQANGLPTSQITTYTRGAVTVDNIAADFSGMTNISGSSFTLVNGGTTNLDNAVNIDEASFFVNDGVTLSLPSATSYVTSDSRFDDSIFRAEGAGSTLDLSNLTSITGTIQPITYHLIEALDGGTIDLSNVTEITAPDGGSSNLRGVQVLADGANSQVDLSALTSFTNDAPEPDSKLSVLSNGSILVSQLATLLGVDLVSDASILALPALSAYRGTNLVNALNAGTVNLSNLSEITDGPLTLRADGINSLITAATLPGLVREEENGGIVTLI
ncbi:MAG: hypothetical protein AAGD25_36045, partial [Cyanobacteria bacterium P01_F01_bin.150]